MKYNIFVIAFEWLTADAAWMTVIPIRSIKIIFYISVGIRVL